MISARTRSRLLVAAALVPLCGCGRAGYSRTAASDGGAAVQPDDECPYDTNKDAPGLCGCGVADADSDGDSIVDCLDTSDAIDDSFGVAGRFVFTSSLGPDRVADAVTGPDDSVFLTGVVSNGNDGDVYVMKLTNAGTLDTSFNGTGFVTRAGFVADPSAHEIGTDIFFATDGDLIVGGAAIDTSGEKQGFLWKLSVDGFDDVGFGDRGVFLLDSVYSFGQRFAAQLDPATGHIFVLAEYSGTSVWRVLANGKGLDATFGVDGYVNVDSATQQPSMATDSLGNIIVCGNTLQQGNRDAVAWLLNNHGQIVANFGQPLLHSNIAGGSGYDHWNVAIEYGPSSIVLAGFSDSADADHDEVMTRINKADGSPDPSFGSSDGIWTQDVLGSHKTGRIADAVVQADGAIVAVSQVITADEHWDIGVIRITANGERDMRFADGTGVRVLGADGERRTVSIVLQPSGRKLVLTFIHNGTDQDLAVYAFN